MYSKLNGEHYAVNVEGEGSIPSEYAMLITCVSQSVHFSLSVIPFNCQPKASSHMA